MWVKGDGGGGDINFPWAMNVPRASDSVGGEEQHELCGNAVFTKTRERVTTKYLLITIRLGSIVMKIRPVTNATAHLSPPPHPSPLTLPLMCVVLAMSRSRTYGNVRGRMF
jgi:hypothetical protein